MISIVICTYNRAQMLSATLASLNAQQIKSPLPAEIIVVDNNSSDETKQVIEAFSGSSRWPVRSLFEPRQGLSFARNKGIVNALGEIVAFLDDDVLVESHWLEALTLSFQETGAVMIGGKIDRKWDFEPPSWYTNEIGGALISQDYGPTRKNSLAPGKYLIGANMAFKKSIFLKIGNFNTGLGRKGASLIGGEDLDIFERIQKAGGKIYYDPAVIIFHPVEKNRLTQEYMKKWFYEIGRTRGYQMEWRPVHYLTLLPRWEWADFFKSMLRYLQSSGKSVSEKFAAHVWLLYHKGILTERFFRWIPLSLGKRFSIFKEETL